MSGCASMMCYVAAMPSIIGITMSIKITSGPRLRCRANFSAVTCFTNPHHVRFGIHQGRDAKPQHRMIVHHHHTDPDNGQLCFLPGGVQGRPNRSGKFPTRLSPKQPAST